MDFFWSDLFLEARAGILKNITLVFWLKWRQQKDIYLPPHAMDYRSSYGPAVIMMCRGMDTRGTSWFWHKYFVQSLDFRWRESSSLCCSMFSSRVCSIVHGASLDGLRSFLKLHFHKFYGFSKVYFSHFDNHSRTLWVKSSHCISVYKSKLPI